jgi:hypothetical protein
VADSIQALKRIDISNPGNSIALPINSTQQLLKSFGRVFTKDTTTLSITTFSITTLSIRNLSITTFSIMTFGITILSVTAFSIMLLIITDNKTRHSA